MPLVGIERVDTSEKVVEGKSRVFPLADYSINNGWHSIRLSDVSVFSSLDRMWKASIIFISQHQI